MIKKNSQKNMIKGEREKCTITLIIKKKTSVKKNDNKRKEKHDNLANYAKGLLKKYEKKGNDAMRDYLDYDQKEQLKKSEKRRKKEMRDNRYNEKKLKKDDNKKKEKCDNLDDYKKEQLKNYEKRKRKKRVIRP